jgi:hypothetical protein
MFWMKLRVTLAALTIVCALGGSTTNGFGEKG